MKKVCAIIPNYNMPEATDAIVVYIQNKCADVPEIIVVDNDSDQIYPSKYTGIRLEDNVQTTNAWLMGMHYADALSVKYKDSFFAYWLMITSMEFVPESKDPLAPMVEFMRGREDCVGVHASLTMDSTTSWEHLKNKGKGFRSVWMLDNICTLWRAGWFNFIDRFDPRLIFAWGVDLETSFKARQQDMGLYVCDDIQVKKTTDIGYALDRMGMSATERKEKARENMDEVFTRKYGSTWRDLMYKG